MNNVSAKLRTRLQESYCRQVKKAYEAVRRSTTRSTPLQVAKCHVDANWIRRAAEFLSNRPSRLQVLLFLFHGSREHRPSRLQVLLFLFHGIREQIRARRQVAPPTGATGLPQVANPRRSCCNDAAVKAAEVRNTMAMCSAEGTPLGAQLEELHRRGALRHDYDVAYAVFALGRGMHTVDALAVKLDESYAQLGHRCDPVYPPS